MSDRPGILAGPADEYGYIHAAVPHRPIRATWGETEIPDFAWCETCCQTWPCETAEAALDALEGWKEEP